MLGHDDVADHHEAIFLPRLFEDFQKPVAPARAPQIRSASITATGNEVEVSVAVITLKAVGHGRTLLQKVGEGGCPGGKVELSSRLGKSRYQGPPFRKNRERVGHPKRVRHPPAGRALEWRGRLLTGYAAYDFGKTAWKTFGECIDSERAGRDYSVFRSPK